MSRSLPVPRGRWLVVAGLLVVAALVAVGAVWAQSSSRAPDSRLAASPPDDGPTATATADATETAAPRSGTAKPGAGTAAPGDAPGAAPGPAPGAATTHPCAGRSENYIARYAFYGYLYGDGSQHGAKWHWGPSPSAKSSARFRRGAQLNGEAVTAFNPANPATGYRGDGRVPEVNALPDDCAVEAFLMGVIEGEGGADDGLVIDDPDRAHVKYIHDLFRRLGFRVTLDSGAVWAARVNRADWPRFEPWPFATRARVPGG